MKIIIVLGLFFYSSFLLSESWDKKLGRVSVDLPGSFIYLEYGMTKSIITYDRMEKIPDSKEDERRFVPPRVSFHLSKDAPALYEIKEDGNLYFKDDMICRMIYMNYSGIQSNNFFYASSNYNDEYISQTKPAIDRSRFCSVATLLFGVPTTAHNEVYRYRPREGPEFGVLIGADDFDGTWGRIDDILVGGGSVYFRFADDEYQHLNIVPSTEVANRFAHKYFDNFDKRLKNIRKQLLDENSHLSRELRFYFLLDDPQMAATIRSYFKMSEPMKEVRVNAFNTRRVPYEEPEKLLPELRVLLEGHHQKIRKALLDYLDDGKTEAKMWSHIFYNDSSRQSNRRYEKGKNRFVYKIHLYLEDIKSSVTLNIIDGDEWFDRFETKPLLTDVNNALKRRKFMRNYYQRMHELAWSEGGKILEDDMSWLTRFWLPRSRFFIGYYSTSAELKSPSLIYLPVEKSELP